MGIEDWGYRWLKRYMDAPQWVKAPLGRLYSLLPDRLRHGRDYPRYRAEASLNSADELARLADSQTFAGGEGVSRKALLFLGTLALISIIASAARYSLA